MGAESGDAGGQCCGGIVLMPCASQGSATTHNMQPYQFVQSLQCARGRVRRTSVLLESINAIGSAVAIVRHETGVQVDIAINLKMPALPTFPLASYRPVRSSVYDGQIFAMDRDRCS